MPAPFTAFSLQSTIFPTGHVYLDHQSIALFSLKTATERECAESRCKLKGFWMRGAYLISIPWLGSSSSWILPPSGVRRYANSSSMSMSDKNHELMETNIRHKRTQTNHKVIGLYIVFANPSYCVCSHKKGYWWHSWRNSHTGNCLADRFYPLPLKTASRPVASHAAGAPPHDRGTGRHGCLWRHGADRTIWEKEKVGYTRFNIWIVSKTLI